MRPPLGNRFEWCGSLQDAWDRHDADLQAAMAALTAYGEALAAVREADDELDRAGAFEIAADLWASAREAHSRYYSRDFLGELTRPRELLLQSGATVRTGARDEGAEGSKGVADARARESFVSSATQGDLVLWDRLFISAEQPRHWGVWSSPYFTKIMVQPMSPSLEALTALEGVSYLVGEEDIEARSRDETANEIFQYVLRAMLSATEARNAIGHMGMTYEDYLYRYSEAAAEAASQVDGRDASRDSAFATALAEHLSNLEFIRVGAGAPADDPFFGTQRIAIEDVVNTLGYPFLRDVQSGTHSRVMDTFRMTVRDVVESLDAEAYSAYNIAANKTVQTLIDSTLSKMRAEGLLSVSLAEVLLTNAGPDDFIFPGFLTRSVVVETLTGSDAWAALHHSYVESCQ